MTARDPRPTGLEFDQVAQRYDRIRPDYPPELLARLTELTGIGPGSELLEIGSGTGKATLPLARLGCRITCLEPGPELAAVAAAKLGPDDRVEIVRSSLEGWEPQGRRFDLVFAATSWHWVDPAVSYRKAAAVLRPGGALAIWGAGHGFPDGYDSFFDDVQAAYAALSPAPELPSVPVPPRDSPDLAGEIDATGLFGPVTVRRYVWALQYTADSYIELLSTFSGHLVMQPDKRDWLFGRVRELIGLRPSGTITRHWLAILHVTRIAG